MGNVLITGTSSGLGLSLCDEFTKNGHTVYGVSKSPTPRDICFEVADFRHSADIERALDKLMLKIGWELDYVFLNAGVLKPIDKITNLRDYEFEDALRVNLMSSKRILDYLFVAGVKVKNVVSISSGAADKPYDGWSLYCVTKAAMKQLVSCYALEKPETHFLSLAPGVIKTKMQDYILTKDSEEFSSVLKFHKMYDTLPSPDEVANKIYNNLDFLDNLESGRFYDLRNIELDR